MQQWMFSTLFREMLMWKLIRQLVYITKIANHNNTFNLSRKILEREEATCVKKRMKVNQQLFSCKSFLSIADILGINCKTIVKKNPTEFEVVCIFRFTINTINA